MDKITPVVLIVLALIVGAVFGSIVFPTEKTIVQEKIVTKEVKVPLEVFVNETIVIDKFAELQAKAIIEYKNELSDDDDYLVADGNQYDLDQVTFRKFNDVTVSIDNSDKKDVVTTVTFSADLKFADKDVETKAYRTDDVVVVFHSDADEDTEVSID